ncbi:unnamed protein product [Prorocentrum cordatum]|uniref:SSD domain-containing protein n=2 Tax=Prorocentrum cordatum TaxID=2364126 RepID=A0ABN9WKW9_9DINO|nr:unnamed protein product [Polarella glacialis]
MQRESSIKRSASRGNDPEMQREHSIGLRQRGSQRTDARLRNASFCTVASDGNALARTQSELRARRGREVHEEMPTCGRVSLRASQLAARHPCKALCSCWAAVIAITMAGILSGELAFSEEGPKDWMVLGDVHSQALDAIQLAEAEVDCIPVNGTCPPLSTRSQPNSGLLGFSIIYQADEGAEMFTPERLQQACIVERVFLQNRHYPRFCALRPGALELAAAEGRELRGSDCQAQALSVAQLFYGHDGGATADCALLGAAQVAETRQSLESMLEDAAQKLQAGFYVGAGPSGRPSWGRTRSVLGLGYPLEGHGGAGPGSEALLTATAEFWEQLESDMLEHFGKRHARLRTAFWEEWRAGDVEVLFNSQALGNLETARVVSSDMSWLLVSILFVWACLGWRTGSLFLGTVSLLQIVFSIPVAFFFYRFVFQITYFQQLHGILIFIMLGIGADAVFVFSDAWQQSEELITGQDPHQPRTDDERIEDLTARLALAYQRTMISVFNTSFTTAVAFLATAISPIMPIRTMGIFACLLVLSNYVFVITLTPSAFAVWQTYRVDLSRCCCCRRGRPEATAEEQAQARPSEAPKPSWLARCFLLALGRPAGALVSLLLLAGWGGLNCYWAAQLELVGEEQSGDVRGAATRDVPVLRQGAHALAGGRSQRQRLPRRWR